MPIARTPRSQVRERLLAAAHSEFVERGYAKASLTGIARRAGFTKGAVYSNFSSKQDLLAAMLANRTAVTGRATLARLISEPVDVATLADRAARVLAEEVIADREQNLLLAELALHAASDATAARSYAEFRNAQRAVVASELADQLTELGVDRRVDVDHAAFVLVTMMSALAVEHATRPHDVDEESIRAALATVLRGLLGTLAGDASVGPVGLEPTTYGLKVRSSAD